MMRRFEYFEPGDTDIFTVFEGHEDQPFWNRDGVPHFVFTGLTPAMADQFVRTGAVVKRTVDGPETFDKFLAEARKSHERYLLMRSLSLELDKLHTSD